MPPRPTKGRDGTTYGSARSATSSFHAHHLRLISLAAQLENASLILAGADREHRRSLSLFPTLNPPPADGADDGEVADALP